jgi:DNA mismatch endonuclease (patch repair protein)
MFPMGTRIPLTGRERTPHPSSADARRRMQNIRQRHTSAERSLRSALWALGSRGYRLQTRLLPGHPRTADLAFSRAKVAVYVDGCFWHGCPTHGTQAKANSRWWRLKIQKNKARDEDTNRQLVAAGWTVIRIWEHTDGRVAAQALRGFLLQSSNPVVTSVLRVHSPSTGQPPAA